MLRRTLVKINATSLENVFPGASLPRTKINAVFRERAFRRERQRIIGDTQRHGERFGEPT